MAKLYETIPNGDIIYHMVCCKNAFRCKKTACRLSCTSFVHVDEITDDV